MQRGIKGFVSAIEEDDAETGILRTEDVGGHTIAYHEYFMGPEATTAQRFLIKADVGFVIADIHRDIGIFEEREDAGLLQTGAL